MAEGGIFNLIQVLTDGDSITAGYNLVSPSTQSYPAQAFTNLASKLYANDAVTGIAASTIASQMPTNEVPQLQIMFGPPVYTIMAGINDYWHNGATTTQIYASLQSICASAVAAAPGVRVVMFTLLPANTTTIPGWETARQTINSLIRAGGSCPYTVADIGNDPTIGQAGQWSNATYYQADGIHPTAAGDTVIGVSSTFSLLAALKSLGVN